MNINISDKIN